MLRRLLPILCALLIAAPAMGYTTIWEGAADNDIQIDLQVDCYIQIQWQDTQIQFDGTSDFWATQLMGVGYAACPDLDGKFAADPWAGDDWYAPNGIYFESGDGALIFVHSNNDLSMWTHTNGNLAGTINDPANQIPTWFTVALAPFKIGGVPIV
ncbi:MAG: hypothetical protein EHM19_13965, partial [Candidatus Latescibacterota bacterium]